MKKHEAQEALDSIDQARAGGPQSFRPPILLAAFAGLSYALAVFGWGMTEHENLWILGTYIGGFGVLLSLLLSLYSMRLMGVKTKIIPRTGPAIKYNVIVGIVFALIFFGARELRLAGIDYAPHLGALVSLSFGYLFYKHPQGTPG